MVSWGDGEDSTGVSSLGFDGPNTMYDSDFAGLADEEDGHVRCNCQSLAEKFVGFEGCCTGRRFYACAGQDGQTCDFIQWLDDPWPESLNKGLIKIWDMYTEAKDGRVHDAINSLEKKFEFEDEIAKLKHDLKNAQDGLKQVVEEKQVAVALKPEADKALLDAKAELDEKCKLHASTCNMQKSLMLEAEKDMDKFKNEKKKLEYMIADLLKQKEGTRAKLKQIKELCQDVV